MQNTLNYYSSILSEVDNSVEKFLSPKPSLFARGAISLLQSFRTIMATKRKNCEDYFLPILLEQCAPTNVCCDDDKDESDSENDDDELHIW